MGILRPDRGSSAGVVMVGNGSGRTCLWGGRRGRGGGWGVGVHKRHMCRSSAESKRIYYLIPASKRPGTKERRRSSAEERRVGSRTLVILLERGQKKSRSFSGHSPPQQRYGHPPEAEGPIYPPPKVPVGWNVRTVLFRQRERPHTCRQNSASPCVHA